jgi:glycosyltransferase involved in cell wall biosynthesis
MKIIRQYNVDIIHARSRAPAWSCYIAAKKTKKPFLTTFHGVYNISGSLKKYYNSIMTKGYIIIAVSNFIKKHIINSYNIPVNKITVIHRGVDSKYFDPDSLKEEQLSKFRDKYNVPSNTPVILLPCRMTAWKGHLYLISALSQIKHLNFYCIMVGDLSKHPNFVTMVKNKIKELKLQNKIQIFGNEQDIVSLYGIADIVLSTSIEPEAFGRTMIEAQAMKKLIIATNVGGSAETILDGVTGYLVKPNDANELADKISYCLSILTSVEYTKITNSARESVINNFSLDAMCLKTINIYENLEKNI